MNIFDSLILGLVEGLTEFLPVSSTFHLIATSRLLGLVESDFLKLFLVVIQSGAILSVLYLYAARLRSQAALRLRLLASFLPTAIVGAVLYQLIKGVFFANLTLQLAVFALVGLLFILLEHSLARRPAGLTRTLGELTIPQALLIGGFQALSVVPGVSRSGSILFGMLLLGFQRPVSAEYAFMLSLPTILAATTYDLIQNTPLLTTLTAGQALSLLVGLISAFFSALYVMRWLIAYLSSHSLAIFGYYRLVAALVLYLLLG